MAIDKTKRGTAISANVPFALAQAVYAEVKNGRHDSAGGVVRAALRLYLGLDENDEPLPAPAAATDTAEADDSEHRGRRRRGHFNP
ncbi:MAG: type II toxin-antitoxin system ParD family antitoxin [Planctomycetes bacterium]|nr:type II toxin-antitoxin system ParD family antitoxin [Planctomycetota bacterium]